MKDLGAILVMILYMMVITLVMLGQVMWIVELVVTLLLSVIIIGGGFLR